MKVSKVFVRDKEERSLQIQMHVLIQLNVPRKLVIAHIVEECT